MFRAKARPALCGSYGNACSGGRPARLLAAHVDLLADLGADVAVAVDDVGLEPVQAFVAVRSEARRVGKECVSTFRSRWSPYNSKNKTNTTSPISLEPINN